MKIKIKNLNEIILNIQNNQNDFLRNHLETTIYQTNLTNNIQFSLNNSIYNETYVSFCCFIEKNDFELLKNISSYKITELNNHTFEIELNNNHICYLKYQNHFGIYIFNGRPDLYLKTKQENFLNTENINTFNENFNNTVNFIELFLNLIYKNNNETIIELNSPKVTNIIKTKKNNTVNKLPEALKRFYERIGHN